MNAKMSCLDFSAEWSYLSIGHLGDQSNGLKSHISAMEDTTSSPEQRQQIACLMCDLLSLLWSRVVKRCTSCRCFGLESNANDLLLLLWSRSEKMQFVAFALDSKWCPRCSNAKKPKAHRPEACLLFFLSPFLLCQKNIRVALVFCNL